MKTLKTLFILSLILCCISCSTDNNDESMVLDEQTIIGAWSLIDLETDTDLTADFDGIPLTTIVKSVGENLDYTLTFTEDTYTGEGGYDLVTTTTVLGETFEDTQSVTGISETGMYTYNEEEETITFDGNLVDFEANGADMSGFSEEQDLNISFDDDGNLVMTQIVETNIEEEGIIYDVTIDARIVFARN